MSNSLHSHFPRNTFPFFSHQQSQHQALASPAVDDEDDTPWPTSLAAAADYSAKLEAAALAKQHQMMQQQQQYQRQNPDHRNMPFSAGITAYTDLAQGSASASSSTAASGSEKKQSLMRPPSSDALLKNAYYCNREFRDKDTHERVATVEDDGFISDLQGNVVGYLTAKQRRTKLKKPSEPLPSPPQLSGAPHTNTAAAAASAVNARPPLPAAPSASSSSSSTSSSSSAPSASASSVSAAVGSVAAADESSESMDFYNSTVDDDFDNYKQMKKAGPGPTRATNDTSALANRAQHLQQHQQQQHQHQQQDEDGAGAFELGVTGMSQISMVPSCTSLSDMVELQAAKEDGTGVGDFDGDDDGDVDVFDDEGEDDGPRIAVHMLAPVNLSMSLTEDDDVDDVNNKNNAGIHGGRAAHSAVAGVSGSGVRGTAATATSATTSTALSSDDGLVYVSAPFDLGASVAEDEAEFFDSMEE